MKKLVFATMLASICPLSVAQANTYIQANVGHSTFEFDGSGELTDSTVSYGVAVGTAMENGARYAIDYSRLANEKEQLGENSYVKAKIESVGVSAIYDFKNSTPLTPYVGLRVSANRIGFDGENFIAIDEASRSVVGAYEHAHYRKTQAGFGAVMGVQFQVAPNLAIDGAVEYNHLGKINGVTLDQYGAKAGVRVDF